MMEYIGAGLRPGRQFRLRATLTGTVSTGEEASARGHYDLGSPWLEAASTWADLGLVRCTHGTGLR